MLGEHKAHVVYRLDPEDPPWETRLLCPIVGETAAEYDHRARTEAGRLGPTMREVTEEARRRAVVTPGDLAEVDIPPAMWDGQPRGDEP